MAGDVIGPIVRLQLQTVPIKAKGEGYLPEHLLTVDEAAVDAWGMLGLVDGAWVIDAHHKSHPSRRGGGRRPLSVGFTGHYELMAERFGAEVAAMGIAGENIIVDGPPMSLAGLGEGMIVDTADGELRLDRPRVAAPCVEFTSYMLGLDHVAPLSEISDPLGELHDGRRGFIVAADHAPEPKTVRLGDLVRLQG